MTGAGVWLEYLHVEVHAPWSDDQFGVPAFRGPSGPLKHLLEEAQEALDDPSDIEERADCLLLILDANRRELVQQGKTPEQAFRLLVAACQAKIDKNIQRSWDKASSADPVHHVANNAIKNAQGTCTHNRPLQSECAYCAADIAKSRE
jgi:hypothetical protein